MKVTNRIFFSLALIVCFTTGPGTGFGIGIPAAFASSAPAPANDHGTAKDEDAEPQPGHPDYIPPFSINMPMLLIPISLKGNRSHYIFLSYRLVTSSDWQVDKINQKIAWLHDAFMREVFKTNPVDPHDMHRVDTELLTKRFKEIARDVLHEDLIETVYFASIVSERKPPTREAPAPASHEPAKKSGGGH